MDEGVLHNCHDCGVKPGQPHKDGCDVERCSVCAGQRLQCACTGHDKVWARWTGIWPGKAEADFLGMDLNEFHSRDISHFHLGAGTHAELFFRKPHPVATEPATCFLCGKEWPPDGDGDDDTAYPGVWVEGVAGYGSALDGSRIRVFLCDECAAKKLKVPFA